MRRRASCRPRSWPDARPGTHRPRRRCRARSTARQCSAPRPAPGSASRSLFLAPWGREFKRYHSPHDRSESQRRVAALCSAARCGHPAGAARDGGEEGRGGKERRDRAEERACANLGRGRRPARNRRRGRWRMSDALVIAGKTYTSRLLIGTGKYKDFAQTREAVEASGAQIVTVAIRRTNIGQNRGEPSLLEYLPPSRITYLPNTAGCYSAPDAVRTLRLARELLDGHELVKLEVLGDPHTLYPNMPETLKAAEQLVKEGFKVMVYCSDDPIQAQMLEAAGCVAIMPLASLIGSGMGILNPWNLQLVLDKVKVPVLVDAGVGTASDAAVAMELGCDGVLMNTAVAAARNPVLMARAMKKAVEAGREAFLAGRMPKKLYSASPSSPTEGKISSKAA